MSYIRITTPEGYPLDIDGNTEITFDNKSPLFEFESIPGEGTWNFNLPATPRNLKYLGHPTQVANRKVFYNLQPGYSLYFGGVLYATGNIYITRASNSGIDVSFQTAASRIVPFRDYTLGQFNYGTHTLPALTDNPVGWSSLSPLTKFMHDRADGTVDDDYTFGLLVNNNVKDTVQNPNGYVNNYTFNFFSPPVYDFYITVPGKHLITPYFYVHKILERLGSDFFKLKHTGSFITDAELQKLVFYSPVVCTDVNFQAKEFLPEIRIAELYKGLSQMFCLSVLVSRLDDTIELMLFKDILARNEYKDITAITDPNPTLEFFAKKGTQLVFETDGADERTPNYATTFASGQPPLSQISSLFSHPNDETFTDFANPKPTVKAPYVTQQHLPGIDKPAFSGRLMFYRGFQPCEPDPVPMTYPMLSSDNLLWDGSPIPGANYSLNWDGTNGLYNTFWKPYIDFMSTSKNVIFTSQLKLDDVLQFSWAQKLFCNSQVFLPARHKFTVTTQGLMPSIIEAYHRQ